MSDSKKSSKPGFPINRWTKSEELFTPEDKKSSGLYFLNKQGGLDRWAQHIGHVEQHFQQFSEVQDVYIAEFVAEIDAYRKRGLDVTMHTPFLKPHIPEGYLEFDFEWLVVPSQVIGKPVKRLNIGQNGDSREIIWRALEAKMADIKGTIDLASAAGIKDLTMHATYPGVFMNEEDFATYTERVAGLAHYIKDNDKGVNLAIETGGITPAQMVKLREDVLNKTGYALNFNLDTAHLMCDLLEVIVGNLNMSDAEARQKVSDSVHTILPSLNQRILDIDEENEDSISVMHLTQTGLFYDFHDGIEDPLGILTCNEKLIHRRGDRHIMIESKPTLEGIAHYQAALQGADTRAVGKDNSLMLFMGRPCNGKSQAIDILRKAGFIDGNIIRTDQLRESFEQAFSMSDWVGREFRQVVYQEVFRRADASLKLKRGTVIDATNDQRSNRERSYQLAKSNNVDDVYVLSFYCGKDEARDRIANRHAVLKATAETGIMSSNRLCMRNMEHYDRFDAEFEDFSMDELSKYDLNVHVIEVDTSKGVNKINLINADKKSREMAECLKGAYDNKFGRVYEIK